MSVVVINKNNNVIPIDFGEFQLEFVVNDENLSKREEQALLIDEVAKKVKESTDKEGLPLVKEACQKAFTELFNDGAFDKVFELSGGSSLGTLSMLLQVLNGIVVEYRDRIEASNQSAAKYLK